jgi:superfamily I DNA/RNA helicase
MNNEKYKNTVEYVENVIKYKNQQKGTDYYLNSAVEKNLTVKQVLNTYSVKDEYDKAHILLDVMNTKDLNNFTERLKALVTLNYKKNDLKTYSTVHQSKGLTFRNVYYTPPYNLSTILENPDDYVTELNLIYVALTRASDTVYMDNEHMEIFKFYDY